MAGNVEEMRHQHQQMKRSLLIVPLLEAQFSRRFVMRVLINEQRADRPAVRMLLALMHNLSQEI